MASTTEVLKTADDLLSAHSALISRVRAAQQQHRRRLREIPLPPLQLLNLPVLSPLTRSPPPSPPFSPLLAPKAKPYRADLPPAKRARIARYSNYVPEEETIRNDYSQRYVDGGEWPQNWVLGAEPEHRFEEYPKQQRLLNLKKAAVANHALPSCYLPFSNLSSLLPCKFDVILLDPPYSSSFTWDHLQDLPIPSLAADPSFVFLWVGSGAGEGLERGREVLAKWGYRRCEDVVWVKTNKASNQGPGTDAPTTSLFTRTKQHCLIGIRGTVRRSTDSWFVHCNVDTDVIIWEGDAFDPTRKPPEMYTLIENFCLGMRRLEIFGKFPTSLRRGWVTVLAENASRQLAMMEGTIDVEGGTAPWDKESWENGIKALGNGGKSVVPMSPDIDALRPKSPFRPGATNGNSSGTSGGTPVALPMGMTGSRGMQTTPGSRGPFGNPGGFGLGSNQMMATPMVGMGMNPLGGMGMVGEDGLVPGLVGWPGMMAMGNAGRVQGVGMGGMMGMGPQAQMPMGQIGVPTGGGFQGQGIGDTFGYNGSPDPTMGMGWQGQQPFMENQSMWDGVDGMVGMGMDMMGNINMQYLTGIEHLYQVRTSDQKRAENKGVFKKGSDVLVHKFTSGQGIFSKKEEDNHTSLSPLSPLEEQKDVKPLNATFSQASDNDKKPKPSSSQQIKHEEDEKKHAIESETKPTVLKTVTFGGKKLRPTASFDAFWRFIVERKAIDDRRRAGMPPPWTDDPVLRRMRLCNVFRILDKCSQYLVSEVIERGSQELQEVIFRVILFSLFTKIETFELLQKRLGELTWATYDRLRYLTVLENAKEEGMTLYTGAFQKPAPNFGFKTAAQNHLLFLGVLMEGLPNFLQAEYMSDVFEYIRSLQGMGDFLAFQLLLDLSYTSALNFSPSDFVVAGPGAHSGLSRLFGTDLAKVAPGLEIDAIRWLQATQKEHYQRLGLDFSGLGPEKLPLELCDIEHSLCEFDRYARAAIPNSRSYYGQMKNRIASKRSTFEISPETDASVPNEIRLPQAWQHPDRKIIRIKPGIRGRVQKRYLVDRIIGHRETSDGMEYRVHWFGYSDSDDTWEPHDALSQDAPDVVRMYLERVFSI